MKMFTDCSGECYECGAGSGCLAGHGDDDFFPASKQQLIDRLDNNEYPAYRNEMITLLKNQFSYEYQPLDNRNKNMTLQTVEEELVNQCLKSEENSFSHEGKDMTCTYHLIHNEPDESNFLHQVIECRVNNICLMTIDTKYMLKDDKKTIVYIAYIIYSDRYIIELMPDLVSFVSDLAPLFENAKLTYLQDNIIEIMLEQGYSL